MITEQTVSLTNVKQTEHSRTLDYLLTHPSEIGVPKSVLWACKEVQLYRQPGKGLLTDIDILYCTQSGLYIVEYKTSDHRAEAISQLQKGAAFIRRLYSVEPKRIYTYSPSFITEEIQ